MAKAAWTFKNGGGELFLSGQLRDFHFLCCLNTVQVYTKNECPHLKKIYRIMKRGKHLLESIFEPKTHHVTIVVLGIVEHLLQLQL